MVEVKATSKYVRVAPNKARQVIRHLKGLEIDEARRMLEFSPKGVARQILKTLDSAVANAEHNEDLDADDLVITSVVVDEGPTLRRFQPRAMGRAYRIRKRTSHITIAVAERPRERAAPPAPDTRRGRRGRTQTEAPAPQAPEAGEEPEATEPEAAKPEAPKPEAEAPEATDTEDKE
jgi:large subunit ribosomal protein L22